MRTWPAVVGGVVTAAVLSACGDGGFAEESGSTILDEAEKDMQALSSLVMQGELTSDNQDITFDLALNTDGDCQGTLGVGKGEAELRSLDGQAWMRPDAAFWDVFAGDSSELVKQVVGDRWVAIPEEQADLATFCDLDELLSEFGSDAQNDLEMGDTEEVEGQDAVRVDGTNDDGDPVTVWVAVDDPHHILRMTMESSDEPGTVTFGDFDEELQVEAPPEDDIVDLGGLGG